MSDFAHDAPAGQRGYDADIPETGDDNNPEDLAFPDPSEPALPVDRPVGVYDQDTTTRGQLEGETLDQKLAQEEPEAEPNRALPPDANRDLAGGDPGRAGHLPDDGEIGDLSEDVGETLEPDELADADLEDTRATSGAEDAGGDVVEGEPTASDGADVRRI